MSTCSSLSLERLGLLIMPDVLNTLSDAQLVAGMDKYCLAKQARFGRVAEWIFHQVKGSSVALISFMCLYCKNSLLSWSAGCNGSQSLASSDPFFSNLMVHSRLFRSV